MKPTKAMSTPTMKNDNWNPAGSRWQNAMRTLVAGAAIAAVATASAETVIFGDGDWTAQGFSGYVVGGTSTTEVATITQDGITFQLTATASANISLLDVTKLHVFGVVGGGKDSLIDAAGEYITLSLTVSGAIDDLASLSLDYLSLGSLNQDTVTAYDGATPGAGSSVSWTDVKAETDDLSYDTHHDPNGDKLAGLTELTISNVGGKGDGTWYLGIDGTTGSVSIKNVVIEYLFPQPVDLKITAFSYDPGTGEAQASILGEAATDYQFVKDPNGDLDFSDATTPLNLSDTGGTPLGTKVTTDGDGKATVKFDIGNTDPKTFVRAEETAP